MEAIFSRFGVAALFAQVDGGGAPAGPPPDGIAAFLNSPFPLLIAVFVVFYFIMYRPMQRERTQRRAMLESVKKNDRVIAAGGIFGVVTNVSRETDEVTIRVDEATNTKLRLQLGSIVRVLGSDSADEPANK